jgi:hypothetical protein
MGIIANLNYDMRDTYYEHEEISVSIPSIFMYISLFDEELF